MTNRIYNTCDQCKAAGGERVVIFRRPRGRCNKANWSVAFFRDGKEVKIEPDGLWYNYGRKVFTINGSSDKALMEAAEWACERFGDREFEENVMGDMVERELNEMFPVEEME